jgi:hypothetical protein
MIVYWGGWDTNKKLFITVLIGYVLLLIFQLTAKRKTRLDFRAGAIWVLPWFACMVLVSYFFDPSAHPKAFGWVFLINLVVSAAIYWLAVRSHLTVGEVQEHITAAEDESQEEAEQMGATPSA